MSCTYKNLFGAPGTGIHSLRIADIAVADTVMTAIVALAIARWSRQSFWLVFLILILVGELMHYWFCVDSTIAKLIFKPSSSDSASEQ